MTLLYFVMMWLVFVEALRASEGVEQAVPLSFWASMWAFALIVFIMGWMLYDIWDNWRR